MSSQFLGTLEAVEQVNRVNGRLTLSQPVSSESLLRTCRRLVWSAYQMNSTVLRGRGIHYDLSTAFTPQ